MSYVITIARGFGSGGKTLGMKLAKRLGINCYEHKLAMLASQYSGISEDRFEEALSSASFAKLLAKIHFPMAAIPAGSRFSEDMKLFEIQSRIIKNLVEEESCVIVGKCADYVLEGRDNVVSIYVDAPRPYCVTRVMESIPGTTADEANRLITKTDQYRSDYYKFYTGGREWKDMINYDLSINMQKTGEDAAIETIIRYMQVKRLI